MDQKVGSLWIHPGGGISRGWGDGGAGAPLALTPNQLLLGQTASPHSKQGYQRGTHLLYFAVHLWAPSAGSCLGSPEFGASGKYGCVPPSAGQRRAWGPVASGGPRRWPAGERCLLCGGNKACLCSQASKCARHWAWLSCMPEPGGASRSQAGKESVSEASRQYMASPRRGLLLRGPWVNLPGVGMAREDTPKVTV